jgi:hypothetical protein
VRPPHNLPTTTPRALIHTCTCTCNMHMHMHMHMHMCMDMCLPYAESAPNVLPNVLLSSVLVGSASLVFRTLHRYSFPKSTACSSAARAWQRPTSYVSPRGESGSGATARIRESSSGVPVGGYREQVGMWRAAWVAARAATAATARNHRRCRGAPSQDVGASNTHPSWHSSTTTLRRQKELMEGLHSPVATQPGELSSNRTPSA